MKLMKKTSLLLTMAFAMTLSTAAHAVNAMGDNEPGESYSDLYGKTSELFLKITKIHIPELSLQDQAHISEYLGYSHKMSTQEQLQAYLREVEKKYPNLYVLLKKDLNKMQPVKAEDQAALNLARLEIKKIEPLKSKTDKIIRDLEKSQANEIHGEYYQFASDKELSKYRKDALKSATLMQFSERKNANGESYQIPPEAYKPVKTKGTSSNAQ